MPSISVDLPMTKHGYSVVADETFWVRQGILRSTDLRDSMDEQCLADMTASIISGSVIERSKDTLDGIYEDGRLSKSPNLIQAGGAYVFVNRYTFSASARLTGNGFSAR